MTVLQNIQIPPLYAEWNSNLYSNQSPCSHPWYHEGFAYKVYFQLSAKVCIVNIALKAESLP